jgi:hypothetical protein
MTDLRFELEWLALDAGDAAESASFATVRVTAGDVVFTKLYDEIAQTGRTEARLSVVHLGRWFATNWWRLRWEPKNASLGWRLSHELAGAGGGFLWPPLRFVGDGETIELQPLRQGQRETMVRYLEQRVVRLPAATFEHAIDQLMETLLARLDVRNARDDELAELWRIVRDERNEPRRSTLRRREALLGVDPDEIDDAQLAEVLERGDWMGSSAWDEVIAITAASGLSERSATLNEWRAEQAPPLDLSAFIASGGQSRRTDEESHWEHGCRLARMVRSRLRMGHAPLSNADLSELLGVSVTALPQTAAVATGGNRTLSVGFRDPKQPIHVRVKMRKRHPRGHRFELARIIGDGLMAAADDLALPVTDLATARQKAQRAFAQEFLCPEQALHELPLPEPTESDISELADRYDVSEWVIMSTLQNHRLVAWDYFGDVLAS